MTDYIFPLDASKISWGTKLKPKWNVTSYRSVGQIRKALVQQSCPLWTFDIDFPMLNKAEVDKLLAFHAMCKGSWTFPAADSTAIRAQWGSLAMEIDGRRSPRSTVARLRFTGWNTISRKSVV